MGTDFCRPADRAGISGGVAVDGTVSGAGFDRSAVGLAGPCAFATASPSRLDNRAGADDDGKSDLLRVPGKRHSAHRRTGIDHDYRHVTRGDPGVRQPSV
ncbi:hypothetical protein D3C78_1764000 [compost metagenome]